VQTSLARVRELAADDDVAYIELGESLRPPRPAIASTAPDAPKARSFAEVRRHHYGENVLIGLIDVEGFDLAHPDFMRKGKTRFVRIWDQGGKGRPHPAARQFAYGSELTQKHLGDAIKGAKTLGFPATDIEPQSQQVEGSHGTHVAGIAAGNHGVCREAMIAGVVISLPERDRDRRSTFYDSTRLADHPDTNRGCVPRRSELDALLRRVTRLS